MTYSVKEIKKLEKQLDKHYGENICVFHEVAPNGDIHIDVEVFKTRIGNEEFYTLATIGMSEYTMEAQIDGYQNVELMICMPKTWNKEKEVWPIKLLQFIARDIYAQKSILGPFHTVDFQSPVCNNEEMKAIFVEYPRNYFPEETVFKLGKKTIRYLQIYPIYYSEMDAIRNENEEVMDEVVKYSIFDEHRNGVI